ncbi:protein of unknown function [Desulfocicer vacuolatum DSM 3385]|uniref:DUF4391 domain-containing protein n=1 Tax=Desulfocicer vacuolatum DSM 3385 TaxID=1121400 RepID=A0A1W2E857_9BACT|nr:DUF4391 domain-containing protein [Desulfocicer vacuolatum]SMD05901.1 protein of unknown function [Desulfocicer vacuolatum DSM 3385]
MQLQAKLPSQSIVNYKFPDASRFGHVIAKKKIYKRATPTAKVKKLFVSQVQKITWAYKLSPATVNLPAHGGIEEIQVFTVGLKTGELSPEVLQTMDKAIPSPLLFMLTYNRKCRYVAVYKRPNDADKSSWMVSSYFGTRWMNESGEKLELPVVLDMEALYHFLIKSFIPIPKRKDEHLDDLVQRLDQVRAKEREAGRLEIRINKETQFNRRVEQIFKLMSPGTEVKTI